MSAQLVTSGPDSEEDPSYCPECVHEALGGVRSPWPVTMAEPQAAGGVFLGLSAA